MSYTFYGYCSTEPDGTDGELFRRKLHHPIAAMLFMAVWVVAHGLPEDFSKQLIEECEPDAVCILSGREREEDEKPNIVLGVFISSGIHSDAEIVKFIDDELELQRKEGL